VARFQGNVRVLRMDRRWSFVFLWWIPKMELPQVTMDSKILKRSNDLDDLGVPPFRKPPYCLVFTIQLKYIKIYQDIL